VKAGTYIPGNGGPDGIHYDGAVIAYHNQVAARPGSDRHQRAAGTAWLSSTKSPSRAQGKLENQRGVARACGGYSLPPVYMSHRTVTIFFNSKLIVHFGVTFLLLLL
jgi:hypothetical protein